MMEFFSDLLQYEYLSNAFWACLLSGVTCGIVGTYVVCRRMVFLSGGITHSSFGGLGIAIYLGANPILGAMVFAVLSALVRMGGLMSIYPAMGALMFALVVIMTMFSAMTFDPRLSWDRQPESEHEES